MLGEKKKQTQNCNPKTKSSFREKVTIQELAQDIQVSFGHIVNQNLCEVLTEEGEWEALWFSCTMEELKMF